MACDAANVTGNVASFGSDSMSVGAEMGSNGSLNAMPFWHDRQAPGCDERPECCGLSVQPSGQINGSAAVSATNKASDSAATSVRTLAV